MKRFFCVALIFILCFCSYIVSAENLSYLKLNVDAVDSSEAVISASGTAKLKFSISSVSGSFGKSFTVEKLVNCSTNKTVPISSVSVDASKSSVDIGTFDVAMNASDSGKTVDFQLFFNDGDGQHNVKTSVLLAVPNPKVSIKTDILSKTIVPGESVSVTYSIYNIGNVPISGITVTDTDVDKLAGRDYVFKMKKTSSSWNVGEGIDETITFKASDTFSVAPVVSFQYNGTAYEQKIEPYKINCDDQIPSISLAAESYSVENLNDSLNFNYSIKNTTNVVLKNIRIYNGDTDNSQVVYVIDSLAVGSEYDGIFSLNITKSGFYKYKVLYSYDGASEDKEISAKTLKAIRLPGEVSMSVVSVSPTTITQPGELTFNLRIENKSNTPLKDVSISEANNLAKKVTVASSIAAFNGESTGYDKSIVVKIPADNTNLSFILSYFLDDEEFALKLDYTVKFEVPLETTAPIVSTPVPSVGAVEPITQSASYTKNVLWIVIGSVLLFAIACAIVILFILRGNYSALAPIQYVKRFAYEIFDNSENGTLFDVPDDAEDDEDVKIFGK